MYRYGKTSLERLDTCDPRLQQLAHELIKYMDITVLWGHRDLDIQDELYAAGKSKVRFGKHNVLPSKAMDIAPWPYQETDLRPYYYMGGMVRLLAKQLGIDIRWGGDWDSDGDIRDQTFNDLQHVELI